MRNGLVARSLQEFQGMVVYNTLICTKLKRGDRHRAVMFGLALIFPYLLMQGEIKTRRHSSGMTLLSKRPCSKRKMFGRRCERNILKQYGRDAVWP